MIYFNSVLWLALLFGMLKIYPVWISNVIKYKKGGKVPYKELFLLGAMFAWFPIAVQGGLNLMIDETCEFFNKHYKSSHTFFPFMIATYLLLSYTMVIVIFNLKYNSVIEDGENNHL